jgi:hypothetical protein
LLMVSVGVTVFILGQIKKAYDIEIATNFNVSSASATTALRLTPTSLSVGLNQTVSVDVNIDTGGENIDGVDLYFLRYNPAVLQVVDDDTATTGVQIQETTLLPITLANSANNVNGTLQFSQTTSGGSTFSGTGKLATIVFRGIASGSSNVTLDFTAGSTTDTNVSATGADRLSIVQNSAITVDGAAPTVSVTAPVNGATVSGTISVSATATDNVAVSGVQFKVDGGNIGAEDTSSPYSVNWDTSSATNGAHSVTAVARDAANNSTTSTAVSVSVSNVIVKNTTIILTMEGRSSRVASGVLTLLNSNKAVLNTYNFTTNINGQTTINISALPQQVYLKVAVPGFLTRLNGPFDIGTMSTSQTFAILLAGDLNSDNIVNSIDYSAMNARWFLTDPLADINQDGIVNTIDFSLLNKNWFVSGQV